MCYFLSPAGTICTYLPSWLAMNVEWALQGCGDLQRRRRRIYSCPCTGFEPRTVVQSSDTLEAKKANSRRTVIKTKRVFISTHTFTLAVN
jgi:hypothetical protein